MISWWEISRSSNLLRLKKFYVNLKQKFLFHFICHSVRTIIYIRILNKCLIYKSMEIILFQVVSYKI
jgi:hypothetical protein